MTAYFGLVTYASITILVVVAAVAAYILLVRPLMEQRTITLAQRQAETDLRDARNQVRYFTIRQIYESVLPGREGWEYENLSQQISVHDALLGIADMGFAPARIAGWSDLTPKVTGQDRVLFPGDMRECPSVWRGVGKWVFHALTEKEWDYVLLESVMSGNSVIAAVKLDSLFAGEFPPEWEQKWRAGRFVNEIQTAHGSFWV